MRSKTINLFESIQQNSITNVINKVAEQFKSEIIEEYKASETKEMSTELENKITKALALEGVDSPEDWVADVCSVALDMTPTGEALATERMENRYGMKESADLKESDGPFSGVEFEKNVPHEMRFKEYNFVNINDLYWVTQQPFSLNQLNQFAEAFKNTKFSKAYVTVRDFSTYDFENDLSRNVFAIIDKYNDIIDPTGYVEAVKKEGWEKILEESEDISNEA